MYKRQPVKGGTLRLLSGTQTEHWDPQRTYVGAQIELGNRLFARTLTTWGTVKSDTEQAGICLLYTSRCV